MRAYIYIHVTAGGVFFQGSEAKGGRGSKWVEWDRGW